MTQMEQGRTPRLIRDATEEMGQSINSPAAVDGWPVGSRDHSKALNLSQVC